MSDFDFGKIRQLDFTLLAVFRALLRHRRATAAARELGLSPSAISHALTRLRRLFGEELFLRRPHGLEPTQHALALGPRIDALLREANEAMGLTARFTPKTAARDFRIAAPDHVATLLAPRLLAAFAGEAPGSRFALRSALGEDALEALRHDQIDLAVGQFGPLPDELSGELLYTDRYVLVARRDLNKPPSRAAFEKLPHVMISVSGDFRAITDETFRAQNLKRRVVASVPRFAAAFDVVRAAKAVAIAPERLARSYLKAFDLSVHPLPVALAPFRILMVRRRQDDPGRNWLADHVRASLQDLTLPRPSR